MAFGNLKSGSGQENEDLAEINIIPLVDVMLVLLIIFMVAAPLSITGIKVNLPKVAAKGSQVSEDKIILSVSKEGDYFIDKTKILPKNLKDKLVAIFENKTNKQLYIRADRDVAYGKVVDVMSVAKLSGVQKMSMLTKPKDVARRR